MSIIHITDGQTDQILDDITAKYIIDDEHMKSLESTLETFDFTVIAKSFSEHLTKRNRLIIPDEDGAFIEFIIQESIKDHGIEGLTTEVYSSASYLELKRATIIEPQTINEYTRTQCVSFATNGTEWVPGIIEGSGFRTFTIENHTNPYAFLKRIANEFDLELRFRVEKSGGKIVRRYVDLLERNGQWRGREAIFGKDLDGISRKEKTDDIVTALLGLGPEREDGTRLEVLVEDADALERWGRNGNHIIETYEPQSSDQDMSLEDLEQYTRTALNKRINEVVEYESGIVDLEHVPGMENKVIRFGDTIRIKDVEFVPPLYLEARVFEQRRSIVDQSKKRVKLGDYTEFTEEEVRNIWQSLQAQIREKISEFDLVEYTYAKDEIDGKDEGVYQDGTVYSDAVALTAEERAKEHAEEEAKREAEEAEQRAKDYAVAKQEYDAKVAEIMDGLADKAELEYVDGQLQLKADSGLVDSIYDTVDGLQGTTDSLMQRVTDNEDELSNQDGRITTVASDLDTVEGNLNLAINQLTAVDNTVQDQQISIDANASAISLKASQDDLDTVTGDVSSLSTELGIQAGRIDLKAEQSSLENLEGNVTNVTNDLGELSVSVDNINLAVTSLQSEVSNIEIGGRNLVLDSYEMTSDAFYRDNNITRYTDEEIPYVTSTGSNADLNMILLEPNEQYTVSSDMRNVSSGGLLLQWYDSHNGNRVSFAYADTEENETDTWKRFSATFTSGDTPNNWFCLGLRNGDFRRVKLEKGNKATDWTPAPQDVDEAISSVQEFAASIDIKADNIIANVSSLESTVNNNGTQITDAWAQINIQADLIEQRVEKTVYDADQNDVIDFMESTNSWRTQTDTAIDQRVEITTYNSGIGNLDNKIDDIEIGGRNLFNLKYNSGLNIVYSPLHRSPYTVRGENNWNYAIIHDLEGSSQITISGYYLADPSNNGNFRVHLIARDDQGTTLSPTMGYRFGSSTEWTFFKETYDLPEGSNYARFYIRNDTNGGYCFAGGLKVEKGNKATDWTPSPVDTDARISQAFTAIDQNAYDITLRASQTDLDSETLRIDEAFSELSIQAGKIDLKAESSTVEGLETRVDSAEININGLESEIDLRVEKDGVIGSINLTSESATIDVEKLAITGDVEIINGELKVTHLSAATGSFEGDMTAGTINVDTDATIGDNLYLGELDDYGSGAQKVIYFNEMASIGSYGNDIQLDAVSLQLNSASFLSIGVPGDTSLTMQSTGFQIFGNATVNMEPIVTVVSEGSNSDGHYVRYSNGVQICWHHIDSVSTSTSTHTEQGMTFYRGGPTLTFPVSFSEVPAINYDGDLEGSAWRAVMKRAWSASSSSFGAQFMGMSSFSTVDRISYIAIGRWD
ncbi:phage tail spike protein [Salipaludibacillus sp. HK11]|uniref:phage tail spike protein n=1 Tax=Salipaludibacillus sp. HK11 TaxID=3394320 RepID=UPI0039FC07CC